MKLMGIEALYPKPKKKSWLQRYSKFPFLLKNFEYKHPNHVWAIDITYIPVENGFLYLVAIIDVYSRYILTWELSNSLESTFCVDSIEKAFKRGTPLIFNSDKGAQFTSYDYISLLQSRGVQISMSGTGRCWDNIFIERFWRSLKYEEIYLKQYNNPEEAHESIETYILHYNNERPHSALNYNTPTEMYYLKEKK
jgi:putative transposase